MCSRRPDASYWWRDSDGEGPLPDVEVTAVVRAFAAGGDAAASLTKSAAEA